MRRRVPLGISVRNPVCLTARRASWGADELNPSCLTHAPGPAGARTFDPSCLTHSLGQLGPERGEGVGREDPLGIQFRRTGSSHFSPPRPPGSGRGGAWPEVFPLFPWSLWGPRERERESERERDKEATEAWLREGAGPRTSIPYAVGLRGLASMAGLWGCTLGLRGLASKVGLWGPCFLLVRAGLWGRGAKTPPGRTRQGQAEPGDGASKRSPLSVERVRVQVQGWSAAGRVGPPMSTQT